MPDSINWLLISFGSIVGSIILSIIANLVTSPVQNQLAKLSKKRATKRIEELNQELATTTEFVENREKLLMFLLEIILKTTVLSAISGIIAGFGYGLLQMVNAFLNFYGGFVDLSYGIMSWSQAIISISIYNLGSKAVRVVGRVRNYQDYKNRIESFIASLTRNSEL